MEYRGQSGIQIGPDCADQIMPPPIDRRSFRRRVESPWVESQITQFRGQADEAGDEFREAVMLRPLPSKIQVHPFLHLDLLDEDLELFVPAPQEGNLLVHVLMHGLLDSLRADHNHIAPHQRRHQPEQVSAGAPKPHRPARPCPALGHRLEEFSAMVDFMLKHGKQERQEVALPKPCDVQLRPVDANGAVFPGVVDLENSLDGLAGGVQVIFQFEFRTEGQQCCRPMAS